MEIKCQKIFSKGKGKKCILGQNNDIFWVLEEHLSFYRNKDSRLENLVEKFNNILLEQKGKSENLTLFVRKAYKTLQETTPSIKDIPLEETPMFSLTMFRINKSILEYYILGSGHLVVKDRCHLKNFNYHNYYKRIDVLNERKVNQKEIKEKLVKDLNREDGYYVGTFDGKSLSKACVGLISIGEGDEVAIFTNNFLKTIKTVTKDNPQFINYSSRNIENIVHFAKYLKKTSLGSAVLAVKV